MSVSIVETNPVVPSDPSINENGNEQIERIEIVEGNGEKSETTDIIGKSYEVEEFIGKKSRSPTKSFYHNLINKVSFTTRGHVKALLSKNWYRITRHPGYALKIFYSPAQLSTLFTPKQFIFLFSLFQGYHIRFLLSNVRIMYILLFGRRYA